MADPHRDPGADTGTPPRMPRWVKLAAIVAGILVLLFVVLKLTGIGGEHGPGRHMSGADPAPASDTNGIASFAVVRG